VAGLNEENLRYAEWIDECQTLERLDFEPNPDHAQQWLVTFDVLVDHWVIGTDDGILWIDEQFLYLAGKHTSFAIPGHRLGRDLDYKAEFFRPLERRYSLHIATDQTQSWPKNLAIQFDVKNTPPFIPERLAIQKSIEACYLSSDPGVDGQLPPIVPTSTAHSRTSLKKQLGEIVFLRMASLALVLMGEVVVLDTMRFEPLFMVLILVILCYQIIGSAIPRIKLILLALKSSENYSRVKSQSSVRANFPNSPTF
jgi:hypothetical protein